MFSLSGITCLRMKLILVLLTTYLRVKSKHVLQYCKVCFYSPFAHAQWKIRNITVIYNRIAEISASYGKSGLRNSMVTLDFTPEMEMWPFRACAMKNMQYNMHRYLQPSRRNFRVLQEIVVKVHDGDVILYTGHGADSTFHRTYC